MKETAIQNQIHLSDVKDLLPQIGDGVVDLAIIDPPYYKISKEPWEDGWTCRDDGLKWTAKWVGEISRVLRLSGSLYLYGCSKNLLTLASVGEQLEKTGFEFRQEIIVNKGMKAAAGRTSRSHKTFPMVSENILLFVKDAKPFVRELLQSRKKFKGLSSKEINAMMGFQTNGGGNWTKYAGETRFPPLPTKQHWDKLQNILDFNLEYEKIAPTFNTRWGLTNVWDDINFGSEKRIHPTQKPCRLAERLIKVSSNEGNFVLDLFSGSGNVSKISKKLKRHFIGIEACESYHGKSLENLN